MNRAGHFRRTKHGDLAWVESHQVLTHIAEHGQEPRPPKTAGESAHMGKIAMEHAIKGHNVVTAMYRKGIGWVDFLQGDENGGIKHIRMRRNEQHADNPKRYPDGITTLRLLPDVIARGQIVSGSATSAVVGLERNGIKAMLAKTGKDHWLLTGFQIG